MKITFNDAINEYFVYLNHKLKFTTFKTDSRKIEIYIKDYFKDMIISDLTTKDYLNWQLYINSFGFSYHYKSSLHYCFTTFLDYCMIFYNLNTNVARKVGNFRNDSINLIGNIWTIEEFNKFIHCIDDLMYKTLYCLLYFTGMRKGEALALTWNDIDFKNNILIVNKAITRYIDKDYKKIVTTPKTRNSLRTISFDKKLKNYLIDLKKYYINQYSNKFNNSFFVFGGIESISFTSVERHKNKYCKIANVKQIKIHEFRHSHACLLFQKNIPIEDISYRLGHRSLSITMDTYLRFLPRNEKRVIDTLNSIYNL